MDRNCGFRSCGWSGWTTGRQVHARLRRFLPFPSLRSFVLFLPSSPVSPIEKLYPGVEIAADAAPVARWYLGTVDLHDGGAGHGAEAAAGFQR